MADKNTVILVGLLILIAGTIYYIDSTKPMSQQSAPLYPAAAGLGSSQYPLAPELAGITGYINAPDNLTMASLRGKVVLLDFWTYSCINCIRTIPYLESWQEKYGKDGLVVLGVHSPEFDFEKNIGNVRAAVQKFGITYPVVLDSNHATWDAYGNQYWPHDYLIDASGRVRFDHIGEGGYNETESEIVQLLSEARNSTVEMNMTAPNATGVDFQQIATPEIYFGNSFRRESLGNAQPAFAGQEFNVSFPAGGLVPNVPYLEGSWINNADSLQLAGSNGSVELQYSAKSVNIVAGSQNSSAVSVFIDGKPVPCQDSGAAACAITGQRLYTLYQAQGYGSHTIKFDVSGSGFRLYTFTFG